MYTCRSIAATQSPTETAPAQLPAEKVPELIAGITTADVQAAAKKLSSAKLSMGACGNLSAVPYLDSLGTLDHIF
jgi:hypothetical protein